MNIRSLSFLAALMLVLTAGAANTVLAQSTDSSPDATPPIATSADDPSGQSGDDSQHVEDGGSDDHAGDDNRDSDDDHGSGGDDHGGGDHGGDDHGGDSGGRDD